MSSPHRDHHAALAERVAALSSENDLLREQLAGKDPSRPRPRTGMLSRDIVIIGVAAAGVLAVLLTVGVVFAVRRMQVSSDGIPRDGKWHVGPVAWKEAASPGADIEAVSGRYGVGPNGRIVWFDGNAWVAQSSGTDADLHGIIEDRNEVVAVGARGTTLYFSNATRAWTAETSDTSVTLRGVAADNRTSSSGSYFIAVGDDGAIVERKPPYPSRRTIMPARWERQRSGTSSHLLAVTLNQPRLIAMGEQGAFLTSVNGSWTRQETQAPMAELFAAVRDERGLFVLGHDGSSLRSAGDASPWVAGPKSPSSKPARSAARCTLAGRIEPSSGAGSAGPLEGLVVLFEGVPWFYSGLTGWHELPAPPEPLLHVLPSPGTWNGVLGVAASGHAYELHR